MMEKLSNLAKNPKRSFLFYGDSGVGKTVLATSFPGPVRVFDFDCKLSSAADFYSDKKELLGAIDFTQYPQPKKGEKRIFTKFAEDLNKLAEEGSKYRTIVFDSLTALCEMVMEEEMILRPGKADRDSMAGVEVANIKDYQVVITYIKHLLKKLLSLECEYLIITAHVVTEKDENTGILKSNLQVFGKDLPNWIPKMFEEVYFMYSKLEAGKPQRFVQTQADLKHVARSQMKKMPPSLNVTAGFKEIEKCFS